MPGSDTGNGEVDLVDSKDCKALSIISISDNDVKVLVKKSYYCAVCYEPYEKTTLNSNQAVNVFRTFCKCLKVNSANTAFDFSHGADFPLCECCSEFSLNLFKLYHKWEFLREKIQEKVEEVLETLIESELARKEAILKIRESLLEDIKQDRKVDSFRKQVIKACEETNSNGSSTETTQNDIKGLLHHEEENKYSEIFKNFKIKQEIFDTDSMDDDEIIICDSEDDDEVLVLSQDSEDAAQIRGIKCDETSPSTFFRQPDGPDPIEFSSIKPKPESPDPERCDKAIADSLLIGPVIVPSKPNDIDMVKVDIDEILQHNESENDNVKSDFLTLNYNRVDPVEESDEGSNETTVFKHPTKLSNSKPIVSFEHILKKSPSDNEEDIITTSAEVHVPEKAVAVPAEKRKLDATDAEVEVEEPPTKTLRKSDFSSGEKILYKDGKAFFQNVEIILLNNEKSRLKCSLCSTITKNTKGKKAITKIRTHIIATHYGMYNCTICNKKCRDNFNLRAHMKTHPYIPEENFACELCSHTCGSKAGLKMHVLKKHGNEGSSSVCSSSINATAITKSLEPSFTIKPPILPPVEKASNSNSIPTTVTAFEPKPKPTIKSKGKKRGPGRPHKKRPGRPKGSPTKASSQETLGKSSEDPKQFSIQKGDANGFKTGISDSDLIVKRKVGRPRKNVSHASESLPNRQQDSSLKQIVLPSTTLLPSSLSTAFSDSSNNTDTGFVFKHPKFSNSNQVKRSGPGRPPKLDKTKINSVSLMNKVVEQSLASENTQPQPPPAPYIALNFNNDSDSEEESDTAEEFFDRNSAKTVDPLSVDEDTSYIPKSVLDVGMGKTTINDSVKAVDISEPVAFAIQNPENVEVEDEEDDDLMPMVTSTVSLARNQLPSSLLQGILLAPCNKTTSSTNALPVQNNSAQFSTSVAGMFRVDAYRAIPNSNTTTVKPVIEKSAPKLVEIVSHRGNGNFPPVAVISSGTVGTLRCGSCGFMNASPYDNLAAALKAIKIHIYQKHFSLPSVNRV